MRTVLCRRYGQKLEGLAAPPFPGAAGEAIYRDVSRRAWQEWLGLQTMLINEKQLQATDPEAQAYLAQQRESFLAGGEPDRASGYRPRQDRTSGSRES